LVTYLEKFSETEFKGKRAIEVGSGTGLGGIALAHLGATVILTDISFSFFSFLLFFFLLVSFLLYS
jgi:methylase of polypeptide subunit release factors